MNLTEPTTKTFNPIYRNKIKKDWPWLMTIGVIFLLVGSFAILESLTATLISLYAFGGVLLLSGLGYVLYSLKFWWNHWSKFFQYFILGALYLIAGIIIMKDPMASAYSITALLSVFFMFAGLWKIISAFGFQLPRAIFEMLSGILSFLLGLMIWMHWPTSGQWVIGLFIGIDMLFIGLFFVMVSLYGKELSASEI